MTGFSLPDHVAAFPVTELYFTLRAAGAGRLPVFLGPALRGALGHALRLTACPMQCQPGAAAEAGPECLHAGLCGYASLFEPPHLPGSESAARPFVLLPPTVTSGRFTEIALGDNLLFGVRLFGHGVRHVSALIGAVARLGRLGLGPSAIAGARDPEVRTSVAVETLRQLSPPQHDRDRAEADTLVERLVAWESGRVPFDLDQVNDAAGRVIWTPGEGRPAEPVAFRLGEAAAPSATDHLRIHFVTPLRLEFKKQVEFHPTARSLVRATLLRLEGQIQAWQGRSHDIPVRSLLDAASSLVTDESGMTRSHGLERYSSSQRRELALDGVLGHLDVRGEALPELLWLFRLAEILHLGSDTVQGLGRIDLEVPSRNATP